MCKYTVASNAHVWPKVGWVSCHRSYKRANHYVIVEYTTTSGPHAGVKTIQGACILFFATIAAHDQDRPSTFLAVVDLHETCAVEDGVTMAAGMQPAMFKVEGQVDGQASKYAVPVDFLTCKACLCSTEGSNYLLKFHSTSHMR